MYNDVETGFFALNSKNEARHWMQAPELKPGMQILNNESKFIPVRYCLCFQQNSQVSTEGLVASTKKTN